MQHVSYLKAYNLNQKNIFNLFYFTLLFLFMFNKVTITPEESSHDTLSENMNYRAYTLVQEKFPYLAITEDPRISYSLWYSQGDGVSFRWWEFEVKKDSELWKTIESECKKKLPDFSELDKVIVEFKTVPSLYEHENTFYVYTLVEYIDTYGDYNYSEDEYNFTKELTKSFRAVCKELETYGYECIEEDKKQDALYYAFNRFIQRNNIDTDYSLWDFEYTTEPTDNPEYLCVSDESKVYDIKWLWVKMELQEQERMEKYFTIK